MRSPKHPARLVRWWAIALVMCAPAIGVAEDERQPTREEVRALLMRSMESDGEKASERLAAMGWAAVVDIASLGTLDLSKQDDCKIAGAALEFSASHGRGESLYRLCRSVLLETDDEHLKMSAIDTLSEALGGWIDGEDPPRVRVIFDPLWWPDLLLALHKTEVVEIEGFYSGPGFPSWNLAELLAVHGRNGDTALPWCLRHEDWRVRMMALPFLAVERPREEQQAAAIHAALERALSDPHPRVRLMAVQSVLTADRDRLYGQVLRLGQDSAQSAELRAAAMWVLDKEGIEPAASEALLFTALRDPDQDVRRNALDALRWDSDVGSPRTDELTFQLLWSPDEELRLSALGHLRDQGIRRDVFKDTTVDVDALVELAGSAEANFAGGLIELLARSGQISAAHVPTLMPLLASEEHETRAGTAIMDAVGRLREAGMPFLPALQEAAERPPAPNVRGVGPSPSHRVILLDAVRLSAAKPADLGSMLGSADPGEQIRATYELVRRRDRKRLRPLMEHSNVTVASLAIGHLAAVESLTEEVVAAVQRAYGRATAPASYKIIGAVRILGNRLEPYADRFFEQYRRTPSEAWWGLLVGVDALRPHAADFVWRRFQRGEHDVLERLGRPLSSLLLERVSRCCAMGSDVQGLACATFLFNWAGDRGSAGLRERLRWALERRDREDPVAAVLSAAIKAIDRPDPWVRVNLR